VELLLAYIIQEQKPTTMFSAIKEIVKENCMVTLANHAQFHGQDELQSIDQFSNVGWLMIMSTLEELIKC